mmetsp:Transcript_34899/g.110861  ORF Transcript_34899/g.110861 Transcript_34899/m.110861 type:complete len:338 (-) Transcript_34899:310-1323(-)
MHLVRREAEHRDEPAQVFGDEVQICLHQAHPADRLQLLLRLEPDQHVCHFGQQVAGHVPFRPTDGVWEDLWLAPQVHDLAAAHPLGRGGLLPSGSDEEAAPVAAVHVQRSHLGHGGLLHRPVRRGGAAHGADGSGRHPRGRPVAPGQWLELRDGRAVGTRPCSEGMSVQPARLASTPAKRGPRLPPEMLRGEAVAASVPHLPIQHGVVYPIRVVREQLLDAPGPAQAIPTLSTLHRQLEAGVEHHNALVPGAQNHVGVRDIFEMPIAGHGDRAKAQPEIQSGQHTHHGPTCRAFQVQLLVVGNAGREKGRRFHVALERQDELNRPSHQDAVVPEHAT